jgi:hypothetical protein
MANGKIVRSQEWEELKLATEKRGFNLAQRKNYTKNTKIEKQNHKGKSGNHEIFTDEHRMKKWINKRLNKKSVFSEDIKFYY